MQYTRIVYDFADQQPNLIMMLIPSIFAVMGLGAFVFYMYGMKFAAATAWDSRRRTLGMYCSAIFTLFTSIISAGGIYRSIHDFNHTKTVYENRQYGIAEGIVETYHPMPSWGHDVESFTVQDVQFAFSDGNPTYGYSTPASHGGAIRSGVHVRISYFHNGEQNVILKLEIE